MSTPWNPILRAGGVWAILDNAGNELAIAGRGCGSEASLMAAAPRWKGEAERMGRAWRLECGTPESRDLPGGFSLTTALAYVGVTYTADNCPTLVASFRLRANQEGRRWVSAEGGVFASVVEAVDAAIVAFLAKPQPGVRYLRGGRVVTVMACHEGIVTWGPAIAGDDTLTMTEDLPDFLAAVAPEPAPEPVSATPDVGACAPSTQRVALEIGPVQMQNAWAANPGVSPTDR